MADRILLESLLEQNVDPIGDLNSQLPLAAPVTEADWVDQCSELIYGVDPRSHTDPQARSINLPKSRVMITPFQLWEAWKMLNQRERTGGLRGGLQASAAGTGKSFLVLISALLRSRCFETERLVKEFWSKPKKGLRGAAGSHLPASASGAGLKCPSQKDSDICCYCVPTSKARAFVDAGVAPRGVSLIQAPLAVIKQWISVFESAILDTSAYNLCIVHADVPARLKRDIPRVTKSLSQPAARGSLAAPETYIFLSSHGNTRMLQTFTQGDISVGAMFSDESHQAMRVARSMAIAEAQATIGDGLDLWLVSATPIRLLEDWELPMSIFCNSSYLSRTAAVADIIAARNAARSSEENMQTFREHWESVFDDKLVFRNTATSQFCGKAITDLQVIKPNRVWFTTPQQHFDHVQEVARQAREVIREQAYAAAKNDQRFEPAYASGLDPTLHFVSLFPGAANLIQLGRLEIGEADVMKTINEMKHSNKLQVENIARFQQHLETVTHDSPKLDFILAEIERMRRDSDKRPEGSTVQSSRSLHKDNPSLKKMVIITPTLGTAVFLYLFLRKRLPHFAPVLFHASARPEHREAVINSFTTLTARKNARHSYILITPFASGGTGLNLQSANYQIFTSPLSTRDSETQGFARTNRTGQALALHHSVLIMQDNPADKINVVNYGGRSFRNDPFEMSREIVLVQPDGSKVIQRLEDWGYKTDGEDSEDDHHYYVKDSYPIIHESQHHAIRVFVPSMNELPVDDLMYFDVATIAGDTIAIAEAWNNIRDVRPKHEKLPLREIISSVWVRNLNRPIRSLRAIMYYTVVQRDLRDDLRPRIYRLMGLPLSKDLILHHGSESRREAEAFSLLLNGAPFCAGAQKMLEENPDCHGMQIESFEFLNVETIGNTLFNFRINFHIPLVAADPLSS